MIAVLGVGLTPSFHAPEGGDQATLLRLAPLGLPVCVLLLRLVISAARTRPSGR
jgi:hypothetical protein